MNETCIHARKGQALVDIARADRQVRPVDVVGAVQFIDDLLRKLRMGRSRRNQYHHVRHQLRLMRAMCKAVERFWGPPPGCFCNAGASRQ